MSISINTITEYKINNIYCFGVAKNKLNIGEDIKNKLINTKNKYDKPYNENKKNFIRITKWFEPSFQFKKDISKKYNTPHTTNAWLKAYEMFSQYKLIPSSADSFVYFDNASFPGSFILAANHYVKTQCKIKDYKWYASSMLDTALLDDSYGLYKNYPNNWIMNNDNNGDVTKIENQILFEKRLSGLVDLYTSDLGFDVSKDYNNQEKLHMNANVGQILTGLLVLKDGGSLITKQYTLFEDVTISIIGCLTFVFKELKIIKPMFSKEGNSEVYLFGSGYRRDPKIIEYFKYLLINKCENVSTLKYDCMGDDFLNSIKKSYSIFHNQMKVINKIINEYNKLRKKNIMKEIKSNIFIAENKKNLDKWSRSHKLKVLEIKNNIIEVI